MVSAEVNYRHSCGLEVVLLMVVGVMVSLLVDVLRDWTFTMLQIALLRKLRQLMVQHCMIPLQMI